MNGLNIVEVKNRNQMQKLLINSETFTKIRYVRN